MADLAHLKNVRAGHKGVVTKKLSDLEDAMKATPRDEDSLRQLRTVFQEKLDIIKRLNDEIVALLTDEADIVSEIAAGDDLKDNIRGALFKIEKAIGSSPASSLPPTMPSTSIGVVAARKVKSYH